MDDKPIKCRRLDWLALWILFPSACSLSGWLLSALGCLNPIGYLVAFGLFAGVLFLWGGHLGLWKESVPSRPFRILRTRYLVPKIWLVLTILIALGGLIYHPSNFDYLTYRFPRVLHWWWEQRWHWISTINGRMNYSGTGFEWLMVPLVVFFKTDRLFFLINLVSYLFLPGLIFSVFRQLGISGRVCWWWMWVLPSGYCYLLQAGSSGNDSFAAVYALASIYYAQRRGTDSAANLLLSTLSVALLTGAKVANLPLVLPWLIAVVLHRHALFSRFRPGFYLGILIVAGFVSFLPMALLNLRFTGDYAGDPQNIGKMKLENPVGGFLGNGIQILITNLAPPIWPKKTDWEKVFPVRLETYIWKDFPRCNFLIGEMQIEETAGVGLGVTAFAALMLIFSLKARPHPSWTLQARNREARWIVAGAWLALLAYMCKVGSESGPRLIAAYYPLLIASVLVAACLDGVIVRTRTFQVAGWLVLGTAFPLLILNPARPLFPAQTMETYLKKLHAPSSFLMRYDEVYGVYASRYEGFHSLQAFLPASERTIGLIQTGNDPEAALWRPFGSREIIEVTPMDTIQDLQRRQIRIIVISHDALSYIYHIKIDDLLVRWSARLITQKDMTLLAHKGPETWYVVSL